LQSDCSNSNSNIKNNNNISSSIRSIITITIKNSCSNISVIEIRYIYHYIDNNYKYYIIKTTLIVIMETKNKSLLTLYDEEMDDSRRRYQMIIGLPKIQGIPLLLLINIDIITTIYILIHTLLLHTNNTITTTNNTLPPPSPSPILQFIITIITITIRSTLFIKHRNETRFP